MRFSSRAGRIDHPVPPASCNVPAFSVKQSEHGLQLQAIEDACSGHAEARLWECITAHVTAEKSRFASRMTCAGDVKPYDHAFEEERAH